MNHENKTLSSRVSTMNDTIQNKELQMLKCNGRNYRKKTCDGDGTTVAVASIVANSH